MDVWTTAILAAGPLVGVGLGWVLERHSSTSARRAQRRDELVRDVAEVLGATRVFVSAASPDSYALWAGPERVEDIDKRRAEADLLRPRLAALAVRWPAAAEELTHLERYLANTPTRLSILVETVLSHADFRSMLDEGRADHTAAIQAIDAATAKLPREEI